MSAAFPNFKVYHFFPLCNQTLEAFDGIADTAAKKGPLLARGIRNPSTTSADEKDGDRAGLVGRKKNLEELTERTEKTVDRDRPSHGRTRRNGLDVVTPRAPATLSLLTVVQLSFPILQNAVGS